MNETRPAAEEARDPSTSPERLMELTERHPQLQGLIIDNPSCPDVARQWILATNKRVRAAHEAQDDAEDDGPETQAIDRAVAPAPLQRETIAPDQASDDEATAQQPVTSPSSDPDAESVWGLPPVTDDSRDSPQPSPSPSPAASPAASPVASTGSVREVRSGRGVVPLGPSDSVRVGPATFTAEEDDHAYGYAPEASAAPTGPTGGTGGEDVYPDADDRAAGDEATGDDGDSGRSRATWWACAGCLLLALVVVVAAIFGLRAWLSDDSDSSSASSSTATASTAESSSPEKTTEKTTEADASPAPDDAKQMGALTSPTGNITCTLDGDTVGCTLAEHRFDAGDCSSGDFSISVSDGKAAPDCRESFGSGSPATLAYGESATKGDVACSSARNGMSCWNVKTGKGFFVSKSSYDTF